MSNKTIKIMTYNIHFGIGMDKKVDFERIAEVIRQAAPDIVGLQEVVINHPWSPGADAPQLLSDSLNMKNTFARTIYINEGDGEYGIGLLSKSTIEVVETLQLPSDDGMEPRVALIVKVKQPFEFYFIVSHFSHEVDSEPYRVKAAQAITKTVQDKQYTPAILVGDFNSNPHDPCLNEIRKNWTICNDANPTLTYPSDKPEHLIDYICYYPAEAFSLVDQSVIDEQLASDHRPITAILQFA
jgi:endonuclease/exonuclease/phosphatase family metal-dependent hydrolase